MSWAIGFDDRFNRDIGYGVPAWCDHPDCRTEIDRGLSCVCAESEPYGGENGCGLYFCSEHLIGGYCERCVSRKYKEPFTPKSDHPDWIEHKLADESWQEWRDANPNEVSNLLK